ncbi:WD40 repeat protein [Dispira parvispora]|uniref:WD40 repeat protein n=1 Tax=Dispira parvispora TaxID=1520584 RepID=A0A9W8E5S2_9FUNG|nr:WD40 repeat protein [Dispira parvispora]
MYWRFASPKVIPLDVGLPAPHHQRNPWPQFPHAGLSSSFQADHGTTETTENHQTTHALDVPGGPSRPILKAVVSPDDQFLLAMTVGDVYLWSLQPLALLAVECMSIKLAQQMGPFLDVVWRPKLGTERYEFAIVTAHGYLRRYWVMQTARTAYQYQFRNAHYFVPGPGEEQGITVHTIRIMHSLAFTKVHSQYSLAATEEDVLIVTHHPHSGLAQVRWDSTWEETSKGSFSEISSGVRADAFYPMERLPWLTTTNGFIRLMVRDPWADIWCWVSDHDKICLVKYQPPAMTNHSPIESKTDRGGEWIGTGTLLPISGKSSPGIISTLAMNPSFSLTAVGTTQGEIHMYQYHAGRHALHYLYKVTLVTLTDPLNGAEADTPPASPIRPATGHTVTTLTWSKEGLVLTATTHNGTAYLISVYGSIMDRFTITAVINSGLPNSLDLEKVAAVVPVNACPFWIAGGTDLIIPLTWLPDGPKTTPGGDREKFDVSWNIPSNLSILLAVPFVKSLAATQPSLLHHRQLVLQGSRQIVMGYPQRYEQLKLPSDPGNTSGHSDSWISRLDRLVLDPGASEGWSLLYSASPAEDVQSRHRAQPTESNVNPDLAWHVVNYPSHYLSTNWPVSLTAVDGSGRYLAIAGRRGFAIYSQVSQRWKLFRNQSIEQSFQCQGGMAWYEHWLVVAVKVEPNDVSLHKEDTANPVINATPSLARPLGAGVDVDGKSTGTGQPSCNTLRTALKSRGSPILQGKYELRVYTRKKPLDDQNMVFRTALSVPPLRVHTQPGYVLVLDLDGHVHEYAVSHPSTGAQQSQRSTARYARSRSTSSPVEGNNLSIHTHDVRADLDTGGYPIPSTSDTIMLTHRRQWNLNSVSPALWQIRGFHRGFHYHSGTHYGEHWTALPTLTVQVGGDLFSLMLKARPVESEPVPSKDESALATTSSTAGSPPQSPTVRQVLTASSLLLARQVEFFVPSTLVFTPRTAVAWVYSYDSGEEISRIGASDQRTARLDPRLETDLGGSFSNIRDGLVNGTTSSGTTSSSRQAGLSLVMVWPSDTLSMDGDSEFQSKGSRRDSGLMIERVPASVDFYPLGVVDETGLTFGVEWAVDNPGAIHLNSWGQQLAAGDQGQTLLHLSRKTQLVVHWVTQYALAHHLVEDAQNYLAYFEPYVYFPHILELLVHITVEQEADSLNPDDPNALLPDVIRLVNVYEACRLDVVAHCARKSEVSLWRYLFHAVGGPQHFFNECLSQGKLRIAAESLIIMQTLLPLETGTECVLRLLKAAVQVQDRELCVEVVKFLSTISTSDPELLAIAQAIGIPAGLDF